MFGFSNYAKSNINARILVDILAPFTNKSVFIAATSILEKAIIHRRATLVTTLISILIIDIRYNWHNDY